MHGFVLDSLSLLFALLSTSNLAVGIPLSDRATDGLTVSTAQGPVTGTLISPRVRQFLGIPYATAARWTAPSAPPQRSTTFNANQFGTTCVESLDPSHNEFLELSGAGTLGADGKPLVHGDACLSANIWAPSTSRPQGTAVLLWVYGGSFEFGTSNFAAYIGQNFVDAHDDITVVTFNYRMNIFGQPNAPQFAVDGQPQNFGLLDINAAIEWVHSNIAIFGGDPERITLFGQSAGSVAIDAYAYASAASGSGKVKGIIMESGTLDLALSVPIGKIGTDKADVDSWNAVAKAVGCGTTGNAAQLACMRAVDPNVLEKAVLSTDTSFTVIADDATIFSDTRKRAAASNFLHVPMLIGSTANEGDIFIVAEELLELGFTIPGVETVVSNAITKVAFTCPAKTAATDRTQAKVPVFRYQYDAVFPDISTRDDLRAYHASEIPIVFGTYNASTASAAPTANEIALSQYVQSAWVAFARNPTSGLTGNGFAWPEYGATQQVVLLGNDANPAGKTVVAASSVDADCGIIDDLVDAYNDIGFVISLL
ncbi:alpha/beta-hydrolase [Pholiota conissans]|uniref:Carboxylic ester hydrolase n=1 Tax=Pholiota conissans TaxID=109636 RepID=A0A9P5YSV3_9AGAR|nr:alpha/beta-hydrolase [Pholiota conissans]